LGSSSRFWLVVYPSGHTRGDCLTAWWQHLSGFDGEWLAELLRQPLAHQVKRRGQLRRRLYREATPLRWSVAAFARSGNGGLIVTAAGAGISSQSDHRPRIRFRLPAIYPFRYYAIGGGLMTYGTDTLDLLRRAVTSIASSGARSQPICRSRGRPITSW
jgi:hypothetical protein